MEQYYRSIISGERAGALPALLRAGLRTIAFFYEVVVRLRNWLYDTGRWQPVKLPVPVISVGNITTGGTGKTPTVILIVQELLALGHHPAVLTRGYGAPAGQTPDETLVIQRECPNVPVIVNPDRIAGGRAAIAAHHANVLVMDDGFQHRRLHRDLNIVLVDATEPMGIPGLFPRGTWREPPAALARAHIIMLTRCEQVDPELADMAAQLLTQWVSPRHIYQQFTEVLGVFDQQDRPIPAPSLTGRSVLGFAGIANPNGFLATLRSLGLNVAAGVWFDDHHDYALPADFARLERLSARRAEFRGPLDAWITTLKDWVKLESATSSASAATATASLPIWHVRIASRIAPRGEEVLKQTLQRLMTAGSPPVAQLGSEAPAANH